MEKTDRGEGPTYLMRGSGRPQSNQLTGHSAGAPPRGTPPKHSEWFITFSCTPPRSCMTKQRYGEEMNDASRRSLLDMWPPPRGAALLHPLPTVQPRQFVYPRELPTEADLRTNK